MSATFEPMAGRFRRQVARAPLWNHGEGEGPTSVPVVQQQGASPKNFESYRSRSLSSGRRGRDAPLTSAPYARGANVVGADDCFIGHAAVTAAAAPSATECSMAESRVGGAWQMLATPLMFGCTSSDAARAFATGYAMIGSVAPVCSQSEVETPLAAGAMERQNRWQASEVPAFFGTVAPQWPSVRVEPSSASCCLVAPVARASAFAATSRGRSSSPHRCVARPTPMWVSGGLCEAGAVACSDCPGLYTIVSKAVVRSTAALTGNHEVGGVEVGSVVRVLGTVLHSNRLRGRLEHPSGWISIVDTTDGFRWAQPRHGQTAMGPAVADDGRSFAGASARRSPPRRREAEQLVPMLVTGSPQAHGIAPGISTPAFSAEPQAAAPPLLRDGQGGVSANGSFPPALRRPTSVRSASPPPLLPFSQEVWW